jgi:hypothetical protein
LYYSPDVIRVIKSRRMKWVGVVASTGNASNAYRILIGKTEGKRPFRRPMTRWEVNIRMNLKENGVGRCGPDSSGSGYVGCR